MENNRITSLWLSLVTVASLLLQDDTTQHWLPPLTPEELKNELNGGARALRVRQWAKAVLHFEHVLQSQAAHREAHKQLALARKRLERMDATRQLEDYYAEGVAALERHDERFAYLSFRKVAALDSSYRDAALLLQRSRLALRQQLVTAHLTAVSSLLLDSLYAESAKAMTQADWLAAIVTLEKIQVLQPGY